MICAVGGIVSFQVSVTKRDLLGRLSVCINYCSTNGVPGERQASTDSACRRSQQEGAATSHSQSENCEKTPPVSGLRHRPFSCRGWLPLDLSSTKGCLEVSGKPRVWLRLVTSFNIESHLTCPR